VTAKGFIAPASRRPRDHRLDLARGVMLLIIFIAHVPNNLLADFIPARFGFSSGAEIFVFCSGIASGLAFGGTFLKKGFAEGSLRIVRRIFQLYAAHLGLILTLGMGAIALDSVFMNTVLTDRYGLELLREKPSEALLSYAFIRYVPPFFDILPMYMILLAAVVPVMALGRISPWLVLGLSALLWQAVPMFNLHLSGHPLTEAPWYFNPFAWQFLFFIGFSFGVGWLKPPERNHPVLLLLSLTILLVSIPLTGWPFFEWFGGLFVTLNAMVYPPDAITTLHASRLIHFLALAYLCVSLVNPKAAWLENARLKPLYSIGRNSFASFLAGVVLSMLGGVVIDRLDMGWLVAISVNVAGIVLLLAFARFEDYRSGKDGPSSRPSNPKSDQQTKRDAYPSAISDDGRKAAAVA
jgi:hypothetical protein